MKTEKLFDYVVLGGGIVGVSTALSLIKAHPKKTILLVEKERSYLIKKTVFENELNIEMYFGFGDPAGKQNIK